MHFVAYLFSAEMCLIHLNKRLKTKIASRELFTFFVIVKNLSAHYCINFDFGFSLAIFLANLSIQIVLIIFQRKRLLWMKW